MSITTSPTTSTDEHGNHTTGAAEAIESYDAAIDRLVRYHVDVVDLTTNLAASHPTFAMGQALAAYLHLMSTDVRDLDTARHHAAALRATPRNDRETAHTAAIDAWVGGEWHRAAQCLDDLLIEWPADILALMVGHQLDFFVGDAHNLRDRIGRSITAFDPQHPHHGFVRGMQAFGLEENGHYGLAEQAALDAVTRNPDDVWGLHAGAHAYEMQGHIEDGIAFMTERVDNWGSGNLFAVHNWWHLALYHLENGQLDQALEIYDREIHHATSDGVPIEMLDATSLLWRLRLDGVDVTHRFEVIAEAWAHAINSSPSWYVFNDVHAVMAFLGAGRRADALAVIERLGAVSDRTTTTSPPTSNARMTAEVGLPLSNALLAFDDGDHATTVAQLWPTRRVFHHFGGSHAQRDVFERTLLEAAVRSNRSSLAQRLVAERLALRPTGRFTLERKVRLTARRSKQE
ncbi:MAG: tetratricopeptide repeat protein [Acidimicrobiia bacterium]